MQEVEKDLVHTGSTDWRAASDGLGSDFPVGKDGLSERRRPIIEDLEGKVPEGDSADGHGTWQKSDGSSYREGGLTPGGTDRETNRDLCRRQTRSAWERCIRSRTFTSIISAGIGPD